MVLIAIPFPSELLPFLDRKQEELPSGLRDELVAQYNSMTVAELRRRGSGRGFRPAQLRSMHKAEIVELFVSEFGWGKRLFGPQWEYRCAHAFWEQCGRQGPPPQPENYPD